MLIVYGVSRLGVRSELIVNIIIEVESSECSDVWIGRRNVNDQIFEMHSQTADVVDQEREAMWFGFYTWSTIHEGERRVDFCLLLIC